MLLVRIYEIESLQPDNVAAILSQVVRNWAVYDSCHEWITKIQVINGHTAQNGAFHSRHPNVTAGGLLQGEQIVSGILDLCTSL